MRKRSELLFSLVLLPIDFLAILAAFIGAYALRVKFDGRQVAHPLGIEHFLPIFLLIIPLWILIFALTGLYNQSSQRGRFNELGKVFVAVSGGFMLLIVLDYLSRTPVFPSKSVPIYAYGLSLIFVAIGRQVVRAVQRTLFRRGVGVYRVVIIGSGELAQQLAQSLSNTAKTGFRVVGAIDTAKSAQQRMGKVRVDNSLVNLINRLGGTSGLDEFIQADSTLGPDEILEITQYATTNHIGFRFIPNQLGLYAAKSELGTLAGMPIVSMRQTPLDGWRRIIKRGLDIVASALGLIILSPLFLAIAIIMKLTDRGPVFYLHKRLSREGGAMYIYKFRSMKQEFCTGGKFSGKSDAEIFTAMGRPDLIEEFKKEQKLKNDPRITKIGGFLRKTSLDELPQLINILKGDISLVGPRPIVQDELEKYGNKQGTLLALRPGLTGLWQVSGRSDIGYEERVKLDVYYIENWSPWLDLKIILQTVAIVLKRGGSY